MSAAGDIGFDVGGGGEGILRGFQTKRPPIFARNAPFVLGKSGEGVIFHGPVKNKQFVDTGKASTERGEPIPTNWDDQGQLSQQFLMKGGSMYKGSLSLKQSFGGSCFPKTDGVKASESWGPVPEADKPTELFENITECEKEVRRLHDGHIQQQSKINFPQLLQSFAQSERIVMKIPCKAIINAPSSSFDILGDSFMFLTEVENGKRQYIRRRVYFVQNIEHKDFVATNENLTKNGAGICSRWLPPCLSNMSNTNEDTDSIQYSLQAQSYLDLITIEDQLLQVFCEQVDGTRLQKDMKKMKSQSMDCRCDCFRCDCMKCNCLPKCNCFHKCNCFAELETVEDKRYQVKARTAKVLNDMILSESKMNTYRYSGSKNQSESSDFETTVTKSNYTAVYLRYRDPLNNALKETVVLVSPTAPLAEVFNFVGLVSQPPNLLQVGSPEYLLSAGGSSGTLPMAQFMDQIKMHNFDQSSTSCSDLRNKASLTQGAPNAPKKEMIGLNGVTNGLTALLVDMHTRTGRSQKDCIIS